MFENKETNLEKKRYPKIDSEKNDRESDQVEKKEKVQARKRERERDIFGSHIGGVEKKGKERNEWFVRVFLPFVYSPTLPLHL